MSHWISYLGIALLPVLAIFPFNIIAFAWGFTHGNEPMPNELASKSRTIDRYVFLIRDIILLLAILSLATCSALRLSSIGLTLGNWQWNILIGIVCGILQLGLQRLVWKLLPLKERHFHQEALEASKVREILMQLISVFAQEFWIAFSVVTLKLTGRSTGTSLLLTAAVFAMAHLPYKLGAVATGMYGIAYASLFIWRASLLAPFLAHYIGNLGALHLARNISRSVSENSSLVLLNSLEK